MIDPDCAAALVLPKPPWTIAELSPVHGRRAPSGRSYHARTNSPQANFSGASSPDVTCRRHFGFNYTHCLFTVSLRNGDSPTSISSFVRPLRVCRYLGGQNWQLKHVPAGVRYAGEVMVLRLGLLCTKADARSSIRPRFLDSAPGHFACGPESLGILH